MKPKDGKEKLNIKLKFAACLQKALKDSEFKSFRELALSIGFEPAHMQRIATGKVDLAFTSVISLAEGLGISFNKLAFYFDSLSSDDISKFIKEQESRKRKTKVVNKTARKAKVKRKSN